MSLFEEGLINGGNFLELSIDLFELLIGLLPTRTLASLVEVVRMDRFHLY
jgi:hypothetical protein